MYNEYFGLQETPFSLAPDPRYLYMSELHREALAHLLYGINSDGGFVLITGEVGTGKTTVCRCLLEQLPENTDIAFIFNPKLTVEELLATICDEFGVSYPENTASIKIYVDLINTYLLDVRARGRKAVLIIDEAQNLDTDVLEQLRLLTNLETNQHKLLQIILLGQPELREILSLPELRQLAQRITARYHLVPLSKKDVSAYVAHRLAVAGLRKQLFKPSTIDTLYSLSGGIPRLINVLCDRALLGTFVQERTYVNKSTLKRAAREVFGKQAAQKISRKRYVWELAALLFLISGILLAASYYFNSYTELQSAAVKPVIPPKQEGGHEKLDMLQWPENQPAHRSGNMAYKALFELWGAQYQPPQGTTACEHAEEYGLRCLEARGSLDELRALNRPAVLKFSDGQGREFYAVMSALEDQTATLVVAGETKRISVRDIALHWAGDYSLMWQVPPDYRGNISLGSRGPHVKWLDEQLAKIQKLKTRVGENPVFDDVMLRQVKEFQIAEGLVPDGIVGALTIIHLDNATGKDIPRLTWKTKDS